MIIGGFSDFPVAVRARQLTLNLPDAVVPLRELSWTPDGSVVIPNIGEARPNDWERQQISNLGSDLTFGSQLLMSRCLASPNRSLGMRRKHRGRSSGS